MVSNKNLRIIIILFIILNRIQCGSINDKKSDQNTPLRPRLVDICSKFSDVKHLAMKAVTTYIRFVKRHEDGEVFEVQNILDELEEFS